MDFITAVKHCLNHYFDFSGRAQRSQYWFFVLFNFLAGIIASVLDSALTGGVLYMLVSLGLLIPGLAVGVRRMHDLDKSGWWMLINLIPLIGVIIWISGARAEVRKAKTALGLIRSPALNQQQPPLGLVVSSSSS